MITIDKKQKCNLKMRIRVYATNSYCLEYKKNWFSWEYIMKTFDLSESLPPQYVCYQPEIFKSKNHAESFSNKFNTIEDCKVYNLEVKRKYRSLLEYRKNNPVKLSIGKEKDFDKTTLMICK